MIKKIASLLLFAIIFIATVFPQKMDGVKVTDAGTFKGSLNGNDFSNMIRYGESDDLVSIATGDENFTLTINFEDIGSISQIKTGTYHLPSDDRVKVLYLDNNASVPFMITEGNLTIAENSETVLKGSLEFTAAMGGIPKEMGGAETNLTSGKFEINKKN